LTYKFIVVIGDIVLSRKIKDRVSFDEIMLNTMEELNQHNPGILSPYTLTIGDEIQAVFKEASSLFHDAISILTAIYPGKMRFSFGVGELTKPINPERAIGMDGPAFYNARVGIGLLKKTTDLFYISGEDIPHLNLLRQILTLISFHMSKWNRTRLQTLMMLQDRVCVKEIAARLQISDKAVYKTISAGNLDVIIQLFNNIETILNECV